MEDFENFSCVEYEEFTCIKSLETKLYNGEINLVFAYNMSTSMEKWKDTINGILPTSICVRDKCVKPYIFGYDSNIHSTEDNIFGYDNDNNLEQVLRLASRIGNESQLPTWFVIITNSGPTVGQQSRIFFSDMIKRLPKNIRLVCFGLDDRFPHILLESTHKMEYITNENKFRDALDTLLVEISSFSSFDLEIKHKHGCIDAGFLFNSITKSWFVATGKNDPTKEVSNSHDIDLYYETLHLKLLAEIVSRNMNSSRTREIREEIELWSSEYDIYINKLLQTITLWMNKSIDTGTQLQYISQYISSHSQIVEY